MGGGGAALAYYVQNGLYIFLTLLKPYPTFS
jgi:hypothetical protein